MVHHHVLKYWHHVQHINYNHHVHFNQMDLNVYGKIHHVIIEIVLMHLKVILHMNNVKNMVLVVRLVVRVVIVCKNVHNIHLLHHVLKELMVYVH